MNDEQVVGPLFEVTTESRRSSVPAAAAAWNRRLSFILAMVLVGVTVAITTIAGVLVYKTATSGSPDAQRLAVGLIGAILGILWSQFTKIYETVMRK